MSVCVAVHLPAAVGHSKVLNWLRYSCGGMLQVCWRPVLLAHMSDRVYFFHMLNCVSDEPSWFRNVGYRCVWIVNPFILSVTVVCLIWPQPNYIVIICYFVTVKLIVTDIVSEQSKLLQLCGLVTYLSLVAAGWVVLVGLNLKFHLNTRSDI